jgi:6-phosphogluconolactonase
MNSSNATGGSGERRKDNEIVVCRDRDDLGRKAADLFLEEAERAIAARGCFSVALSGGATPRALYQRLAGLPFSEKIPWAKVHLFWGDERAVPPDHPDSNYRMAYETLIAHVPIPPENVHRMPAEKENLQTAAEEYEETLRRFFKLSKGEWPSFDLILLGVGPDGHVASLFPGSPALEEKKRWVIAVYVERLKSSRLTLTLPVLNRGREILFLAAGKEKAETIRDILSDHSPRTDLPARRVQPDNGGKIFLLDQEAAGLIIQDGKDLR